MAKSNKKRTIPKTNAKLNKYNCVSCGFEMHRGKLKNGQRKITGWMRKFEAKSKRS